MVCLKMKNKINCDFTVLMGSLGRINVRNVEKPMTKQNSDELQGEKNAQEKTCNHSISCG